MVSEPLSLFLLRTCKGCEQLTAVCIHNCRRPRQFSRLWSREDTNGYSSTFSKARSSRHRHLVLCL